MGGQSTLSMDSIVVLYVEDDQQLREAVTAFLEATRDDFEITAVGDPIVGLEVLDDTTIDCVVSDFDMPEMNGIEFLETVRDSHPELPFVLYTGKGSEEVASDAISSGVSEYLQKGSGTAQYEMLATRIENVVERNRARQAVERTERRYQRLIEESTDVTSVLDDGGRFIYVSPASEQEFGYEPSELLGDAAFEYVHPDDVERIVEAFTELAATPGNRTSVEVRIRRPDGSYRWVESRGRNLLDDPLVGGVVVYSRDISSLKSHARELEAVTSRFEFAVEASNVHVFNLDAESRRIDVIARGGESILGLRAQGFAGLEEFLEHIHPADRERLLELLSEVLGGETHLTEEVRATHAQSGERRWLEISGGRYDGADGPTVLGIVRDVTDRKERELELATQNERLDRFASIVSHDLRNPITVIRGRLDLARETGADEHFEAVDAELDRMEELVDGLLALSRQGDVTSAVIPTAIESAASAAWTLLETEDVDLVVETDVTVDADPDRLRELFENLFRNSLEHGDSVSTVTIGGLEGGFYVADDGVGIPPGERADVLESGYTGGDSTGLGLAIVVAIAEAHGWRVVVTESDSGGARFEFPTTGVIDPDRFSATGADGGDDADGNA